MDNSTDLLTAALEYAAAGFRVLPLKTGDKVPLLPKWTENASTDPEQIRAWWKQYPNANVGISTGEMESGKFLTVVDLDNSPDKGKNGFETLYEWQKEHGILPETLTVKTGGGGNHLYFFTEKPYKTRSDILGSGSGIDVRSKGGCIVAPPSLHKSGRRYEWAAGFDPTQIAQGGEILDKLLSFEKPREVKPVNSAAQPKKRAAKTPVPVPLDRTEATIQRLGLSFSQGSRNDNLFKLAASLQAQGYEDSAIFDIVAKANAERCSEPLPEKELETIMASATEHYSKGIPRTLEAVGGDIAAYTERLAEKFPFILPCEKRDGTITYSVQIPLLAEYVREHDNYFFLDTTGEKPPAFWYGGGCYRRVDDSTFKGLVRQHIEDFDKLLVNSKILDEVYKLLLMDGKRVKPSELDSADKLICFKNGLLNVETLELVPHSHDIYCTIQIPCDWNDTAWLTDDSASPCPLFDSYITTLTNGNRDFERLLWEYMGLTISNMNGYEPKKALFLYGPGDTGKSVLLDILGRLVGNENFASIDLKGLEERFGTMGLWRKRLAGCPDMNFMRVGDLSMFKKITGGDKIPFEQKGKDVFYDRFRGVLLFCTNELPKFGGDKGDHIYERMVLCPCNNVIPPEKRDRRLREKIYAEREGIVYKAVMALRDFRARGGDFIIPAVCRLASEEYKVENDSVLQFLSECTERRDDLEAKGCTWKTSTTDIYKAFKLWAVNNNCHIPSNQDFRRALCTRYKVSKVQLLEKKDRCGKRFYYPFDLSEISRRELLGL